DSPPGEPDWLELHNTNQNLPAAIGGSYIILNNAVSRLPELSFIPPAGYVQLLAGEGAGPASLPFTLPASGGTLAFHNRHGEEVDRVAYSVQTENVSLGRFPNGSGDWAKFPISASPGAANYIPE